MKSVSLEIWMCDDELVRWAGLLESHDHCQAELVSITGAVTQIIGRLESVDAEEARQLWATAMN